MEKDKNDIFVEKFERYVEPEKKGIIYRITNKLNNKCYIGQTNTIYKKNIDIGSQERWKEHQISSLSGKDKCPHFHRAIKKYGAENFILEVLCYCSLVDLNKYEIQMIFLYDSTNKNFGYNILAGGSGIKKISNTAKHIHEFYRKNKHAGYVVELKIYNKRYRKYFTNQKNTLEYNLAFAREYLDSVKKIKDSPSTKIDQNYQNRTQNLPKNIYYYKKDKNKNSTGYIVKIVKNGKIYKKEFKMVDMSMEQKFTLALDYKKHLETELHL